MAITHDAVLDNLARCVQVVKEDRRLSDWFHTLAQMSAASRRAQIYLMVEEMTANHENGDLIASFQLLADPTVFQAAQAALQEI